MTQYLKLRGITYESIQDYKKTHLYLAFPNCTFKCKNCQNKEMIKLPIIKISIEKLIKKYIKNKITEAIVMGGLEPFYDEDSFLVIKDLVIQFRQKTKDDIVIYTGFYYNEIRYWIDQLALYENIYIKFGRYLPDSEEKYDSVLGVKLASSNQYGVKISYI